MFYKISFKNFKIFKNWQHLELKPITILIGKNNSGKSAVARLPTLIAGSLSGRFAAPLKWENEVGSDKISLGSEFKDLIFNKNLIHALEFEIAHQNETLQISLIGDKQRHNQIEIIQYSINGQEFEHFDEIKGFLPEKSPFKKMKLNVDFMGAFRCIPKSSYTHTLDKWKYIGKDGQNAYPILIQDFLEDSILLNKISGWYHQNFEGCKLEVLKIDTKTDISYQFAISNDSIKPINLVNVGQGIHQALPLLVRSFMPDEQPVLIIIEEPETHLHPAAHANLAQRFAESYLENRHKNYLIETHSQNFVLRMRRLVAQNKLKKTDLAIYYVDFDEIKKESSLKEIKVDELGRVDWWPEGVFNETSKETREIYNAQLNHLRNVD